MRTVLTNLILRLLGQTDSWLPQSKSEQTSDDQNFQTPPENLNELFSISLPLAYYKRYHLYWLIAIISLPLDLVLFNFWANTPALLQTGAAVQFSTIDTLIGVAIFVGLCSIFKEQIISWLIDLWAFFDTLSVERRKRLAPWLFAAVFVYSALDPLIGLRIESWFDFFMFMAVLIVVFVVSSNFLNQYKAQDSRELIDPLNWIRTVNWKIFIALVVMLLITRALSWIAIIKAVVFGWDLQQYLPFFTITGLLILPLYPNLQLFVEKCRRCGNETSQALVRQGFCSYCLNPNHLRNRAELDKSNHTEPPLPPKLPLPDTKA